MTWRCCARVVVVGMVLTVWCHGAEAGTENGCEPGIRMGAGAMAWPRPYTVMGDGQGWYDGDVGISCLTGFGLFGLSWATDFLGRHNGQELELSYATPFNWAGLILIPSVGMRWKSRNLADYYYGVSPREAGMGRSPYEGEPAVDPFVRLALRRRLAGGWSLLAAVQYEWLNEEIRHSLNRDMDYDASFMVGMFYAW